MPHDLMPWIGVFGAANVSAELGYETDGVAEPSGLGDLFFFALACSTSILASENKTSAGRSGHCLPRSVMSMMRQAMTRFLGAHQN